MAKKSTFTIKREKLGEEKFWVVRRKDAFGKENWHIAHRENKKDAEDIKRLSQRLYNNGFQDARANILNALSDATRKI